ncbi:MAG: Mrp/NBP35 family ATP-binding protein [Dehalococcoidia bacterium]|nr:Mrp/NBP35 family ATP-binding protein [Dehalococcoidia bacterium]
MSSPRKLTPQEEARLAQVRENFQERRRVTESLEGIGTRIGVYSGKGGVGKTTVAVNLAVTLAAQGKEVALFDCDIDCPNVTRVLRLTEGPVQEGVKLVPPARFGVRVMSMAFFQENEEEAIIWRGPMVHNAINQFLHSTEWGNPDYMIVDLPPGTSDAPLTVMQTLNLDGFVIVTTPQELAILDAKRSINMVRKMNLNVFGIVENMSGGVFGTGGGQALAEEMGIPFLGSTDMRAEYTNSTGPAALESDDVTAEYTTIAEKLQVRIAAVQAG